MKKIVLAMSCLLAGSLYITSGFAAEATEKFEDPAFKPKTGEVKKFEDPAFKPKTEEVKKFEDPAFKPKATAPAAIPAGK